MSTLRPFASVRPSLQAVGQVASVPYDVVDREEAAALAKDNLLSFLRVSRAEIDLPAEQNPYGPEVYAQAQKNYEKLRHDGHLIQDEEPAIYVYRLRMGEHVQVGVAATFSVDEYDSSVIKKHEKTRRDKEDDRTRHISTLRAQTGPVFLTYRSKPTIDVLVAETVRRNPLYSLQTADGVEHTIWKTAEDPKPWVTAFSEVPELYIADGHHRAASASRTRAELKEAAGKSWTGDEPANFFLAVAFPADQLRILPYNRVIADLNGLSADELLKKLGEVGSVTPDAPHAPLERGHVSVLLAGKWYDLALNLPLPSEVSSPSARLDAALLQDQVLAPILGIGDPRSDKRIDFVGGIRGTAELERRVGDGVAFSMFPTSLHELMAISDADEIMPPKSTWFEPKLRDALLIHQI